MAKGTIANAVTHYLWLWVVGAALGAGAGVGVYAWAYKAAPRYTARVPFEVVPAAVGFTESGQPAAVAMRADEAREMVDRQRVIFKQDAFLEKVLNSDEFRPNGSDTPWLVQHKSDPVRYLKRDLVVASKTNAGSFEITFTSQNASEAQRLVQAAVKEYLEYLRTESKTVSSLRLMSMMTALKQVEADYQRASDALADYAKQMQIDVLKAGFEIEKNALQSLNDDYTKADAAAAAAKGQLDTFTVRRDRLRAGNTGLNAGTQPGSLSEGEIADRLLSLEMQAHIDNNATIRALEASRLQWEQELGVERAKIGATVGKITEIQERLNTIGNQLQAERTRLKVQAMQRMEKMLADDANSKRALADYIGQIRAAKEKVVNDLGQRFLTWDQRLADLKAQHEFLTRMRNQLKLYQANSFVDDTRIRQLMDSPTVPKEPSWPKWPEFVWSGAGGGLVVGGLLALALGRGRSRRLNAPRAAAQSADGTFPTA